MLIVLLVVILALAVISFYSENLPESYHKYILWGTIVVLVVICMMRPGSYDSDYLNYEKYFYSFDSLKTKLSVEPTFLWISEKVYYAGGTLRIVIYIYALLSIPLKLYSLRKLTDGTVYILTLIVYVGNYFMLHDCEQFRIAAALAFGMYAIYLKSQENRWWIVLALLGTSFHSTLALLFITLFFCPKELTRCWKIILCVMIPFGVLLWIFKINLIAVLPIPYIETKLKLYELAIANGKHPDVRVLNAMVFLRIFLFYYIIYYYDNIIPRLKCLPILLVCDALSIFTWFALSEMSVIAVRISQLYGFVEVILFACIYRTIRPYWAGKLIIVLIALYLYGQNYIYNQFGFR